jgi:hypothetical protein
MIDPGLVAKARKAVDAKPRTHVTPEILCAFVLQESAGIPYFVDTKPGSIFRSNVNAAISYKAKLKDNGGIIRVSTGLTEPEIRAAITLPDKVGLFDVPAIMRGKMAKFRFEPGYWKKFPALSKIDRFLYSSSWGCVQFMGPNISKNPDRAGIEYIKRFMADVDLQLLHGAGMVDDLLKKSHGDVNLAYRGYNSGNIHSTDPAVISRANNVQKHLREILEQTRNK